MVTAAEVGCPLRVDRADRHPELVGAPRGANDRFPRTHVLVVGLGGVGGPAAESCARLGIGRLTLVDPGRYKCQSLLTHSNIGPEHVGLAKAAVVGRHCKALNPAGVVAVLEGPLQALSDSDMRGVDVVILATDNLGVEVHAAQRAMHQQIPLMQASVDGPMFVAHVRHLPHDDGGAGPCLACGYGPFEWQMLDQSVEFSCDGGGAALPRSRGPPTRSHSFLCAFASHLLLMRLVRHLLGCAVEPGAVELEHAGFQERTTTVHLRRNARCPLDHTAWEQATLLRPLDACTPREVLQAAGVTDVTRPWSLRLDGHEFAEVVRCRCGTNPWHRFVDTRADLGPCERCRGPREVEPHRAYRDVPRSVLSSRLARPLAELGADAARTALVDRGDSRVFLGAAP